MQLLQYWRNVLSLACFLFIRQRAALFWDTCKWCICRSVIPSVCVCGGGACDGQDGIGLLYWWHLDKGFWWDSVSPLRFSGCQSPSFWRQSWFLSPLIRYRLGPHHIFYSGLRCYYCLTNLHFDILQTALVVGPRNHNYLSCCVVQFEIIQSHPRPNTCYAIFHGVESTFESYVKLLYGCKVELHLRTHGS